MGLRMKTKRDHQNKEHCKDEGEENQDALRSGEDWEWQRAGEHGPKSRHLGSEMSLPRWEEGNEHIVPHTSRHMIYFILCWFAENVTTTLAETNGRNLCVKEKQQITQMILSFFHSSAYLYNKYYWTHSVPVLCQAVGILQWWKQTERRPLECQCKKPGIYLKCNGEH